MKIANFFSFSTFAFLASIIAISPRGIFSDDRVFTYSDKTNKDGYGLKDWDEVEVPQYYLNWNRFYHKQLEKNECEWKPKGDDHNQSPIDIDDWGGCNGSVDDDHRWVLHKGSCKWKNLNWAIKPWGLEMTLPMPEDDNVDPSFEPCKKPRFNSSGGYGDHFFMNHLMIKTKSEHYLRGKQYDAEITISLFRYNSDKYGGPPFTTHILVNAERNNPDNPILQPYLDKWLGVHNEISKKCGIKELASLPSMRSDDGTLSTFGVGSIGTARAERYVFDVIAKSNDNIFINSFDVNTRVTDELTIQVFTKSGSWRGHVTDQNAWTDLGVYTVRGKGKGKPTALYLNEEIKIASEMTQAFYFVNVDGKNLRDIEYDEIDVVGDEVASDDNLSILVGLVIENNSFATDYEKKEGGFSGRVHYTLFQNGGDQRRKLLQTQKIDNKSEEKRRLQASKWDYFDPFRLYPSPWFFRYRGSLTMPQCFDDVRVRVVDRALEISERQLDLINMMIAKMRDPENCKLATVGKPRDDGSSYVNVNRPLQRRDKDHKLKYCSIEAWTSVTRDKNFFRDPRGNTCWCLLSGDCSKCKIDEMGNCNSKRNCDSHWYPRNKQW